MPDLRKSKSSQAEGLEIGLATVHQVVINYEGRRHRSLGKSLHATQEDIIKKLKLLVFDLSLSGRVLVWLLTLILKLQNNWAIIG